MRSSALKVHSLVDVAVERLGEMIIKGRLQPGQKIRVTGNKIELRR